jgi:hypothetical protein
VMRSYSTTFRKRTNAEFCLLLMGLAALAGCGPQLVSPDYPPYRYVNETAPALLSEALLPETFRTINVHVFDARAEKVKLVDGWERLITESADTVSLWVFSALEFELGNAGYTVLSRNESHAAESNVLLTVDIQLMFGDGGQNGAHVLLQGTLEKKDQPSMVNQYEGRGKLFTYSAKSISNSMSHALEDAIRQMLVDMRLSESS